MLTVNIFAPGSMDMYDSYGLIACMLARHLTRLGAYVNAISLRDRQLDTQPPDVAAVTAQPVRAALGGLLLGYPTLFHLYGPLAQLGPRVALTMFESSKIPPDWIEPLNACDAVIVPASFLVDVFRACGVTAPIHVVPLGVGEAYTYQERRQDGPLTFLTFFDRGKRKGGLHALMAFKRAFGDSPDVRLVIKTRRPKDGATLAIADDNVEVIHQDMTEAELAMLYQRCHVLINPNLGEGFGLIPREFAATGGIALTTDWGGTADALMRWGYPLPYTLVPADWRGVKKFEHVDMGEWAEPDIDGIAQILRRLAAQRQTLGATARHKAAAARRLYAWQTFGQRVLDIYEEVAHGVDQHRLQPA